MAVQVKLRRGTANQHSTFTGAIGEVTVDLTHDTLRVHDGVLAGGHRLAKYSDLSEANTVSNGMEITLSTPTDTDLVTNGAYKNFTANTKVTDAIDILNEVIDNVRNNTFVRSVSFVADTTSGGAGTNITLTTTVDGTANQYEIDWGDGSANTTTSDSTPSHTYSTNSGSPFSISLTARNTSGGGEGSSASASRSNYITIFTATPVASFDLFRTLAGGSALTGSNLYVVENETLYLDNNTTNIGSANVQYSINWGDGTSVDVVNGDTSAGGTAGSRLSHTWGEGTSSGTGRDTVTLTLNAHSTALPSDIPTSGTVSLKVYDASPTAPNGLSSKTISFSSSTGSSPRLASGYIDNTGGSSYSAGDSVNRTTSTSGTIDSTTISTFAYNANNGVLTALVNGSNGGSVTLGDTDNTGTYTSLVVTQQSDYNLLNASGSSTSFASSIYYPGLYTGFKAKTSVAAAGVSVGVNNFKLSHSVTGDTNTVEYVKDNLTSSPTVSVSSATVSENVGGTKRYISGIPYYNSGSPSLTLSGVTVENLVGQTYTSQSNIVEVDDGSNLEGTSSNAINNTDYSYSDIDGITTMLDGSVPLANTGIGTPYAIGDLTIPITSSSVRTISRIKVRARNVNGTSSYSSDIPTTIQVHKNSQSGISEIAIAVSDSLGSTYTDDGVRIFDFSADTTDNPTYTSSTNFYTNSPYTESSDPGVQGTKEATVRLGSIKHDTTDYSSGYLPAGPDRSSDTGTQYFTFAFRRTGVANFNINITSSSISGLWIAAPGTSIDSTSTINGWLDASTTYNGSGVPGADISAGGNGSNGCAFTTGDRIGTGTALSGGYTMTLGSENMSNATNNVVLVRIALASGESVSSLSVGVAS
jgi:hypothetical protein